MENWMDLWVTVVDDVNDLEKWIKLTKDFLQNLLFLNGWNKRQVAKLGITFLSPIFERKSVI